MLTNQKGYEIEQQQYLPAIHVDEILTRAKTPNELEEAKRLVLSHIFTLRKENRHLLRRL